MKRRNVRLTIKRKLVSLVLTIVWGGLYCIVMLNLPIVQQWELDTQDSLIRLHNLGTPPNEILILKINTSDITNYDLQNLQQLNLFYANLVKNLIENDAKIVVLNLPEQMKQYVDIDTDNRLKRPLKALIEKYPNQIVLVSRPNKIALGKSTLNIYHNLLPINEKTQQYSIAPQQIVSYFRRPPNPHRLNNLARRADLWGRFSYEDDSHTDRSHRVKSVAVLALEKFYTASNNRSGLQSLDDLRMQTPFQINFWGPTDTFPSINFQFKCTSQTQPEECQGLFDNSSLQQLHDKLVIVDLLESKTPEIHTEYTPYGEMSIAEVQANLIASLMTHSFLKMAVKDSNYWITILGLLFMQLYVSRRFQKAKSTFVLLGDFWVLLALIGSYSVLSFVLLEQGLILPLGIPIVGWIITGIGIGTYSIIRQSTQQRQKLAERQAALLQARKLLHRVATDIHDGPLQELKLVMDKIELLTISQPSLYLDPLLDQLETIGLALRNQLSNTRTIAGKLEVTPELQLGLSIGIQQWIQQLINSGDLTLKVNQHLQSLRESKSDSAWIDAREDIFRFFREAIANVIRHAQPPNGTATEVSIYLSQDGTACQLIIENNGTLSTTTDQDKKRGQGGYGTKIMATIASELPKGIWERIPLESGGMRVTLKWEIATF
jgi:signal transduction histidine kinase